MSDTNDRTVLETTLVALENVINGILHSEILSGLPLLSIAVGTCKSIDSIRDKAFVAKVAKFISGFDGLSEQKRQEMKDKLTSSPKEAQKIGETLFLVLERINDLDKPLLLSKLFLAYIDGVISGVEFRRFATAVDELFLDDLKLFIEIGSNPELVHGSWMQRLVNVGLTEFRLGMGYKKGVPALQHYVSSLGEKFQQAYSHSQKMYR